MLIGRSPLAVTTDAFSPARARRGPHSTRAAPSRGGIARRSIGIKPTTTPDRSDIENPSVAGRRALEWPGMRICVFCGSRAGERALYRSAAQALARALTQRGHGLVYGGGRVGLMGTLADAVLDDGGEAIGVIPEALVARELAHPGLTRLHIVASMHARKALMVELADAFIALPGGFGTWDELCEVITWSQLGLHAKPYGLLDVQGYYRPMFAMFDRALTEGFISSSQRSAVHQGETADALLTILEQACARRP